MTIYRPQTEGEKSDFKSIWRKERTPRQVFMEEVAKMAQKAHKKGLPFCDKAAIDDYDEFQTNKMKKLKRQGSLSKEDAEFQIDWAKYSDLKNFKVDSEGETYDQDLSKRHNIPVYAKKKTYLFKGYENYPITLMEDGPSSIKRALKDTNLEK